MIYAFSIHSIRYSKEINAYYAKYCEIVLEKICSLKKAVYLRYYVFLILFQTKKYSKHLTFFFFQLASVSTVMNRSSIMPFVFRNYSLPYDRQSQYIGSCKYSLYESVRASGAAPTVFQEFCLDGIIHQVRNYVICT